jgi:hypothetical protein
MFVNSCSANSLLQTEARTVRSLVIVAFTPPMLYFARRVRSAGVRVHLVEMVHSPRAFVRPSNAVEAGGLVLLWPAVDTEQGLAAIQRFVESVDASALIASDDSLLSWLGRNRARFEPRCKVAAPEPAALESLWNKAHQVDRAAQSGFDLLPGWSIASRQDIDAIPAHAFPVVIRPVLSSSALPFFKARVLRTRNGLHDFYAATRWTHPPIVQRFCLGPNYVLHGTRSETGEILALRLFLAYRKYAGFTTSMCSIPLPAELAAAARTFVDAENLVGPFHFELLGCEADSTLYFLEINCRLGGTTGKATQLGYDEPGLLLQAYGLKTPGALPEVPVYSQTTTLSLNLSQAFNDLFRRPDPLAYPQMPRLHSFFAALKEALLVNDGRLDFNDPISLIRYLGWNRG